MKKILVIDDDREYAELTKELLGCYHFDAAIVINPLESLAAVEREKPDLILLDTLMPQLSGDEVLEALKRDEEKKKIPVILLTGKASADDFARQRRLGAGACLLKPVAGKRLLETINQLLGC